ncbi:MAG: hypothetical protein U0165_13615 [Polyangiaceae bacterium]
MRPGVDTSACAAGFAPDELGKVCLPVLPASPCPDGTMPVLGQTECQPVGIPASACAPGFNFDNQGGCAPVLPEQSCSSGLMAVPGDASCREVAPCGTGTWGDIPVDASTVYVDQSYDGSSGASDGSATRPFTTIQAGINAASSGAIVAIAEGSYAEGLQIYNKPVKLWGVCPSKVEVVGPSSGYAAIDISSADGAEVHDLAVRGSRPANVGVYGCIDVKLDRLWVHDGPKGLFAEQYLGANAHVLLSRSLVENNKRFGWQCAGVECEIEDSEFRGTRHALGDQPFWLGGQRAPLKPDQPGATLSVRGSRFDDNDGFGIAVLSSTADIDSTVVQNTRAVDEANGLGNGIAAKIVAGGTAPLHSRSSARTSRTTSTWVSRCKSRPAPSSTPSFATRRSARVFAGSG